MILVDLLNSPESSHLARCAHGDDECIKTVCALANTEGGHILLGVSANGSLIENNLETQNIIQFIQRLGETIQPAIIPDYEIHETEGKTIALLHVAEAPLKPVMIAGKCYRRAGSTNVLLSLTEIAQLHFQSLGRSWDAMVREEARLEDIDADKVKRFVELTMQKRRRNLETSAPLAENLEKMALLQHGKITIAALLLFGKNPQAFVSHARIKAGRFKSETVIVDEQEITGTLFEQIEQAFAFIQKHLTVKLVIGGHLQREEVWDYPLPALREGLINAICHRDYAAPMATQIRIYDDQLMIWNPGSLPQNLHLDDLRKRHQSVLRNKLIGSIFYDAGLVEKWGSGTNRIIEECKKLGLPEPEWREQQGLILSLRKDRFTEDILMEQDLNDRQLQAVAFVKRKRKITNQEYQELVGVKKRTASDDLRELEEKNIFERVGSTGKGTYYKLKGR
ncbi:transcriptional regulator [candidate division KSB1 bacterium]|nr:MAG: transcriptional regulator [candidate division KSB1 bacterium]MBC6946433.1 transcriptional regulator [candidate division KSB1 bacterium]MCE7942380.1 transcriptional regulator [Chlorobi bacterium CHB1]MDL1877295.1 transcriptional regulator [Cytophagia bacterium CHB2]